MDDTEYLSRISLADHEMLAKMRRRGGVGGMRLDDGPAWPGGLTDLLNRSNHAELLRIQYVTEKYYAGLIKSAADEAGQDELLTLAYLRVIYLQFLRREPDMGFTKRELGFVLAAIKRYRDKKSREPSLLEIGCGAGSLLRSLAEAGFRSISGVDLAPSAVELARKRLTPYGLAEKIQQATTTRLLSAGHAKAFDMVLLCDVIEHVPRERVDFMLAEVRELLRDEGMLIVITPNASTGPHDITRYFQPPGSPPEGLHLHEYSLRDLIIMLGRAGFGRFTGMSLATCVPWAGNPRLSMLSINIRLAVERLFPYLPAGVTRRAVDALYFSALCSWSG